MTPHRLIRIIESMVPRQGDGTALAIAKGAVIGLVLFIPILILALN